MSKQAGVVRSVRKKEERNYVLAKSGSLFAGEITLRRSLYVDATAVRIRVVVDVVTDLRHQRFARFWPGLDVLGSS